MNESTKGREAMVNDGEGRPAMNRGLEGKTAWVGGASRGLGRAICERLAAERVHLVMVARTEDALIRQAGRLRDQHGVQVLPLAGDLSTEKDVQRLLRKTLQETDGVDILVHNTGGPPPGRFMDHGDDAWNQAYEGLLLSTIRLCRGLLPRMQQRGWGRILINTSFAVREPEPNLILSNVFRTGVVALAKTLAREVAAEGITVNCLCPGPFDTERLRALFAAQAGDTHREVADVRAEWESRVPQGRLLQPEELGDLVAFLASESARGITGTTIPVDGGLLHGLF